MIVIAELMLGILIKRVVYETEVQRVMVNLYKALGDIYTNRACGGEQKASQSGPRRSLPRIPIARGGYQWLHLRIAPEFS